jgi:Peptidase family S41
MAAPVAGQTQTAPPTDIALLREILTTLHPGLYRYASPKGIEKGLIALERSWPNQNLEERYLALARFLATIKCGHSYPNFFNQSKAVQKALFDRPTRLPFTFRWIGNEMVVLSDQSGTNSLPRGTVVKTINGVSANAMLNRLLPFVRADGNNDGKRRALLSVTGADSIETFDVFHGLIFGPPRGGIHRLTVIPPNQRRSVDTALPPISMATRQSFICKSDARSDEPVWQWMMRTDGIAVLTMDGWALYNSKWDWQTWLNDRLNSLSGSKGLIIDIRENEGGNDCGDPILARLTSSDIEKPKARQLVRYNKTPDALNRYLDTWDDSFRNWGQRVERIDSRFFQLKDWEEETAIVAKAPHVNVPTVVLTSAQNSSATFQFAALCKSTGLATTIGETTGGNQRGINGGAFFFARLPESGIEFDVPLIGNFPIGPLATDAGVAPDIFITTTAADIANGNDPQLAAAVQKLLS